MPDKPAPAKLTPEQERARQEAIRALAVLLAMEFTGTNHDYAPPSRPPQTRSGETRSRTIGTASAPAPRLVDPAKRNVPPDAKNPNPKPHHLHPRHP